MARNSACVILVTCKDQKEAEKIASRLVKEKLAACVNIIPAVFSYFWWEGKFCKEKESLLVIKSTFARYRQLEEAVVKLHSYTTPEIIALQIKKGENKFLSWIFQTVSRK